MDTAELVVPRTSAAVVFSIYGSAKNMCDERSFKDSLRENSPSNFFSWYKLRSSYKRSGIKILGCRITGKVISQK